jgi:hypothetical protein
MVGCGKDKPTGPIIPQPFQYPALDTPQHVILNVKYSWERRDSVRTKAIYADSYIGTSTDQQDNSTLTFTKDMEVGAVAAMRMRASVTSAMMALQPESTWVRMHYATDPAGWAAIQLQNVNIQVDDNLYGTMVANHDSFFEFKFAPTVDHASPTDTTWQIVGWTEIHQ